MIVGLSHLTVNTSNIEGLRKNYIHAGWQESFFERAVLNHPAKSIFLNKYEKFHHLCVMNKDGYSDIELVQHSREIFSVNNVYKPEDEGIIEVQCSNYEASRAFWIVGMGFEETKDVLIKSSPLPQWNCKIKLKKSDVQPISLLDNSGPSCLAFYTTNLDGDIATLLDKEKSYSVSVSDLIQLEVNTKKLRIKMVQAPSLELVELIELEQ